MFGNSKAQFVQQQYVLAADTPVAAITLGTRPEQRTVRTTLDRLGKADVRPPAIIVIGEVVSLRSEIEWMDLAGKLQLE